MAKGGVPWHGPLGCAGVPSRWENKGDCEMGNSVSGEGPASRVPTPKMAKGRGAVGAPAAASSLPRMRFVSRGTCPRPAGLCWRRRAA